MTLEFKGIGGHQSSRGKTQEWLSPPSIIAALGGAESFDLDPCAPAIQPWPTARHTYTKVDNGLIHSWFGRVYLNPPYRTDLLGRFLARMALHNRGTALIFARTETDAFFRHGWEIASAALFIRGRLCFHKPDGSVSLRKNGTPANAGAPSVLLAYGHRDAEMLAFCGIDGQFVPLRLPVSVAVGAIDQTWLDAVATWLRNDRGPVPLADIYRAFAKHPKANRNPNWRAKIRQVLQQGPFKRVDRGVWAGAA